MAKKDVGLVAMVRAVAQVNGGPVAADVHPDEVAGFLAAGWVVVAAKVGDKGPVDAAKVGDKGPVDAKG